jgi:hypothetical protein
MAVKTAVVPASARPLPAAEDYDATGVLIGMDPSASRYWWMPELYGPPVQATSREATEPRSAPASPAAA